MYPVSTGRPIQPPLMPLPDSGAFHRVVFDVILFVHSNSSNKYDVDNLTKLVEVIPTKDQTTHTITQLLVMVSRHEVTLP